MATKTGDVTVSTECSYKNCDNKNCKLSPGVARVEVKTFAPKKVTKDKLHLGWDDNWEAKFHMECWDTIVKEYRNKDNSDTKITNEEQEMVKEAKKTAEFFNSDSEIKQQAKHISKMLQTAKYAVVFTGAGISTAAGIGDFRGKGGKWTEMDREKKYGKAKTVKKSKGRIYTSLRPTYTHEAICKLVEMGLIKYVISQNVDGIHRLSGVPRDKISELHGNAFIERCENCTARYERQFPVGGRSTTVPEKKCKGCRINHRTGRKCERKRCDGYLMNTIINFGDSLESKVLDLAEENAERNDLMICLGSTLSVTPASDLVMDGKQPVRLVICNRQPTQYDDECTVTNESESLGSRVFGDCDHMMREVMQCILPEDQLEEWEDGRDTRMTGYDSQRTNVD